MSGASLLAGIILFAFGHWMAALVCLALILIDMKVNR